ncbi:inositol 1,4,5-trisphosphate receptor-interacting protein [Colius striatus]|uniref:inositol 1,4,5-trisphosphate receptor-interacting protein n=1 Tax=Colius striatus TaxID=57412 RepID=UPI002B1DAFFA|nr:inositol 1,4,5-trisphosphate receptor-interacting protein [Colius striatus]
MPVGIFRVCLVVIAAIVNQPLLFPQENCTVPEHAEDIIQKMKEREERLRLAQLRLEQEVAEQEATQKALEEAAEATEERKEEKLQWDLWTALSMVIFLLIELWRQDFQEGMGQDTGEEDDMAVLGKAFKGVSFPDKAVLASFYEKRILGTAGEMARMREMVEGFADDLLEALRSVCNRDADMEVEDCIGVGSMYENWRVRKPFVCDLIVPFAPPEPYCFRSQTWCSGDSFPPDEQGYGTIKVCRAGEDAMGCICDKTKLGEDMLCLLHNQANTTRPSSEMEDLLCFKNTHYLDADQVMKWFQIAVTKAWNRISHKYEFDLSFSLLDSPGALKIKFRSGKSVAFNLTPVVQYENSDVYFISHFPRSSLAADLPSSTHWFLTFAVYERRFIQLVSKMLPANACHVSCLQILSFLHGKQCSLTGPSGLTNYHLKTVMLHLLQARPRQDWAPEKLEARLQDMLKFLEKCLHEKKLYHFFIGNGKVPAELGFPIVFQKAEPLNLFRPFVLHRDVYQKTVDTFHEMLRNTSALINEYTMHIPLPHINGIHKESL